MKKTTFRNINKKEFTQMLKQMLMVDRFITLRIGLEETDTTSYFPQHDVVKRLVITNNNLFESSDAYEKPFRISINDGSSLINRLANYSDSEVVDLELTYEEDENENYVIYAHLISERLTTRIFCADRRFMSAMKPLTDNVVSKLIDTTGCDFCFDFETEIIGDVQTLNKLDLNNKYCMYRTSNNRLYICENVKDGDASQVTSDENDVYGYNLFITAIDDAEDKNYRCGKNVFNVMPKCDMHVCLCGDANKVVYEGTEENEHIWLVAVLMNNVE